MPYVLAGLLLSTLAAAGLGWSTGKGSAGKVGKAILYGVGFACAALFCILRSG